MKDTYARLSPGNWIGFGSIALAILGLVLAQFSFIYSQMRDMRGDITEELKSIHAYIESHDRKLEFFRSEMRDMHGRVSGLEIGVWADPRRS